MQAFVQRAFEMNTGNLPRKKIDKLLMVVKYIRDNVDERILSIENTNNNLNMLNAFERTIVQDGMNEILHELEYHPNKIKELFPI